MIHWIYIEWNLTKLSKLCENMWKKNDVKTCKHVMDRPVTGQVHNKGVLPGILVHVASIQS